MPESYNEERLRILLRRRANAEQQRIEHEKLGYENLTQNAAEDVESLDRQIEALRTAIKESSPNGD